MWSHCQACRSPPYLATLASIHDVHEDIRVACLALVQCFSRKALLQFRFLKRGTVFVLVLTVLLLLMWKKSTMHLTAHGNGTWSYNRLPLFLCV